MHKLHHDECIIKFVVIGRFLKEVNDDTIKKEFTQFFPNDGWVEHNALEIWNDVKALISKILKKNKLKGSQILSIGITNQRETTVLWDKKTGKPVYNAIVWQDRRQEEFCKKLRKKNKEIVAPIYKRNIGNPIGFKSSMIKLLNKTKGDSGAKKIIKRNKKNLNLIRVNSKSIFKNFNTEKDFLLN